MEEKTLLRMRKLVAKRNQNIATKEELAELEEIESTLVSNAVCRDLSEQYTIDELYTLFD